jgi:hypothetical protein
MIAFEQYENLNASAHFITQEEIYATAEVLSNLDIETGPILAYEATKPALALLAQYSDKLRRGNQYPTDVTPTKADFLRLLPIFDTSLQLIKNLTASATERDDQELLGIIRTEQQYSLTKIMFNEALNFELLKEAYDEDYVINEQVCRILLDIANPEDTGYWLNIAIGAKAFAAKRFAGTALELEEVDSQLQSKLTRTIAERVPTLANSLDYLLPNFHEYRLTELFEAIFERYPLLGRKVLISALNPRFHSKQARMAEERGLEFNFPSIPGRIDDEKIEPTTASLNILHELTHRRQVKLGLDRDDLSSLVDMVELNFTDFDRDIIAQRVIDIIIAEGTVTHEQIYKCLMWLIYHNYCRLQTDNAPERLIKREFEHLQYLSQRLKGKFTEDYKLIVTNPAEPSALMQFHSMTNIRFSRN